MKGSAEMPPLRQAAIPLCVSAESVVEKVVRTENGVQFDKVGGIYSGKVRDKQIEIGKF